MLVSCVCLYRVRRDPCTKIQTYIRVRGVYVVIASCLTRAKKCLLLPWLQSIDGHVRDKRTLISHLLQVEVLVLVPSPSMSRSPRTPSSPYYSRRYIPRTRPILVSKDIIHPFCFFLLNLFSTHSHRFRTLNSEAGKMGTGALGAATCMGNKLINDNRACLVSDHIEIRNLWRSLRKRDGWGWEAWEAGTDIPCLRNTDTDACHEGVPISGFKWAKAVFLGRGRF